MKRLVLIIDGHNFFFRSLWSVFRQGKTDKILSTEKDIDAFEKKMMVDFCQVIKQLNPIVRDVVFIRDSHSWRKDLLLQQEYKGNRKKSQDNIDKNGFNIATNNFTATIKSMGFKVSSADRSEGDDLIYAWTDTLFNNGISSLIFSTDRDLNQLIKCVNDVHIIQYNPVTSKVFVSKETEDEIKKMKDPSNTPYEDLFNEAFSVPIDTNPFIRFFDSSEIEVVNAEHVRFMKVIGGDTSDNIYPVYYKKGDGKTRSKGLGEKTVEKIYNKFKEELGCDFNYQIYNQDDSIKLLCNVIYNVAKINDEEFTRRMLYENIKTNATLVSLTSNSIPDDVISNMKTNIQDEINKKPVVLSKVTKESIFAKSRFKDYKSSIQMKSNVLKGIKDDGDMSFIKD